jgi:Predicted acetyltransferase
MRGLKPIGQIRLDIDCSDAKIDYSIANDERGYGYGKLIIWLAIKKVRKDFPKVNRLIGRVKPSNVASFYCFEKNGFEEKYQQLELNLGTLKASGELDDIHPKSGRGGKNPLSYKQP